MQTCFTLSQKRFVALFIDSIVLNCFYCYHEILKVFESKVVKWFATHVSSAASCCVGER